MALPSQSRLPSLTATVEWSMPGSALTARDRHDGQHESCGAATWFKVIESIHECFVRHFPERTKADIICGPNLTLHSDGH
jgi:hypothetical protein